MFAFNLEYANISPNIITVAQHLDRMHRQYCSAYFQPAWLPIKSLPPELSDHFAYSHELANILVYIAAYLVASLTINSHINNLRTRLRSAFNDWRAKCVTIINGEATFSNRGFLASRFFDQSCISSSAYNMYSGSNLLECNGVRASNLCIQNERIVTYYETDAQGNTIRRETRVVDTIFSGTLIMVPATLRHAAWVILRPKGGVLGSGLKRIRLSSPQLHKTYIVGATDPFAGHHLLTPVMMDRIYSFSLLFRYLATFSYRDGYLYIAAPGATLSYGTCPTRWRPVTSSSLRSVADACRASLELIIGSTSSLIPRVFD